MVAHIDTAGLPPAHRAALAAAPLRKVAGAWRFAGRANRGADELPHDQSVVADLVLDSHLRVGVDGVLRRDRCDKPKWWREYFAQRGLA